MAGRSTKKNRDGAVVEHSSPTNVSVFDSRTRRQMWVEFVVGFRPCSERFFSGYSGFPLSISKIRFDLEFEGHGFISDRTVTLVK